MEITKTIGKGEAIIYIVFATLFGGGMGIYQLIYRPIASGTYPTSHLIGLSILGLSIAVICFFIIRYAIKRLKKN